MSIKTGQAEPFQSSGDKTILGLLIWTWSFENPVLQKSRSFSNRRKISGPANLDFFLGLQLEKKLGLYYKLEKNPGDKLKKKSRYAAQDLKFFQGLNKTLISQDLDFQKSRCRLKG